MMHSLHHICANTDFPFFYCLVAAHSLLQLQLCLMFVLQWGHMKMFQSTFDYGFPCNYLVMILNTAAGIFGHAVQVLSWLRTDYGYTVGETGSTGLIFLTGWNNISGWSCNDCEPQHNGGMASIASGLNSSVMGSELWYCTSPASW